MMADRFPFIEFLSGTGSELQRLSKFTGVYLPRPTGRTTNELFICVLAVTGIKKAEKALGRSLTAFVALN